ncbi:hypothetical protein ACOSP7_015417 [Xanthoceras sorbifolium]
MIAEHQSPNIRCSDIYLGMEHVYRSKILGRSKGSRLGHDSLLMECSNKDYGMFAMIAPQERDQHSITREDQDNYAVHSFKRCIAAEDAGAFAWEITPVEVSGGIRRPSTVVDKDEGLRKFDPAKLRKVRPSFKETGGTVTAGNASSISGGAAALVLVSGETALKHGLQVIAKITAYADAAFGTFGEVHKFGKSDGLQQNFKA